MQNYSEKSYTSIYSISLNQTRRTRLERSNVCNSKGNMTFCAIDDPNYIQNKMLKKKIISRPKLANVTRHMYDNAV